MIPLLKKEIRLLLPAWITAMALAILPGVLQVALVMGFQPGRELDEGLQIFLMLGIFAIGVLFLGINSFGQELSSGTFSSLLSQPAERRSIWLVKIATLAIAFLSVWLTAVALVWLQFDIFKWYAHSTAFLESFTSAALEFVTLATLLAFSGGLWTTLLLRQSTGAFWFTLLTPLAIIFGLSTVLENWTGWDQYINTVIVVALVLYSIAGFFWAWRLFLRAQDIQWSGGEIAIPWRGKISGSKIIPASLQPRHWLSALVWKEIQLHQSSFVIAAIILVLHLVSFFVRIVHPHIENPDLQFVFTSIWLLWLLMPLLIGATAIAEERRLGIVPSQLCLPVSCRLQLFLKFSVALVLSLLFGGLMPWLLERTPDFDLWIYAVAAGIFGIAFYASSLARTTLQAIGLAVAIAVVICYCFVTGLVNSRPWQNLSPYRGLELLKFYLSTPILLLVLGCLTFWNFKQLQQNWKFWTRNIAAILAAFVLTSLLAHAIFFRVWELVLPLESRGPVRIHSTTQVKFWADQGAIYSVSPDGRLWAEYLVYQRRPIPQEWVYQMAPGLAPELCRGQFIGGSNWVDLAEDDSQTIGIHSDGTLWNIHCRWALGQRSTASRITLPFDLTQIGSETNWSHIASSENSFLLMKKDGSLWSYGIHDYDWGAFAPLPVLVSNHTNWTGLFSTRLLPYAKKSDGTLWMLLGNHFLQETNVDNDWSDFAFAADLSYIEVKTNGELWYRYNRVVEQKGRSSLHFLKGEELGRGMKWKTAQFFERAGGGSLMAIRSDGTLWVFPIRWLPNGQLFSVPYQLGNRSDWIALMSGFSLASDGSIWAWGRPSDHIWLAPPRGPARMGNIFEPSQP